MFFNIKKILYTVGLYCMMLFLFFACSKYTEINPQDALSESTAFTDAGKIDLTVNGMYQRAAIGTYSGGGGRGYPFGAASIEQGEMRGEDMVNLQLFYAITYDATYSATSANNVNMWEQLYAVIEQANVIINGVEQAAKNGIITQEIADSYAGEARFIRALSHHELLIHFCRPYADGNGSQPGVPYRVVATTTPDGVAENLALDRGTVADDFKAMLADLDTAEMTLPETQDNGVARATKGAAIALKTRIKLDKEDWAGVVTEGAKLGTNASSAPFTSPIGGYALEADPATPFTSFSNNNESIFSIANSAASNPSVNGALAQMFGPTTDSKGTAAGRGLVAISPNLYNATFWVDGDKRRSELTVQDFADPKIFYTYKYRDYSNMDDWAPIIRYAEVLLNVAEAEARLGANAHAFALLNAVRNRSVPVNAQYSSQPTDLVSAILEERRIEFLAEGRRWFDIHRLALDTKYGINGIPAKIDPTQVTPSSYSVDGPQLSPKVSSIPYSNYRFLWPIPTSEITSNPTLAKEQNPGY